MSARQSEIMIPLPAAKCSLWRIVGIASTPMQICSILATLWRSLCNRMQPSGVGLALLVKCPQSVLSSKLLNLIVIWSQSLFLFYLAQLRIIRNFHENSDLFVFCGHGSGDKLFDKQNRCDFTLLVKTLLLWWYLCYWHCWCPTLIFSGYWQTAQIAMPCRNVVGL